LIQSLNKYVRQYDCQPNDSFLYDWTITFEKAHNQLLNIDLITQENAIALAVSSILSNKTLYDELKNVLEK
jgi:hypothetical protein